MCFLGFMGCKKNDDDISGTGEISGKLYIENRNEGQAAALLNAHDIFVTKDTSAATTSFLFSSKADKDGYFVFKYLYESSFYRLHAEKRMNTPQNSNILFSADTIMKPGENIQLVLRPDLKKQNGLVIVCMDTLVPGGKIPGVNMFIYTSRVLANLDSAAVSGTGSSYSLTSQNNGTAFKMNLSTDSLFINALFTSGSTKLKCRVKGLKTVLLNGTVITDTIQLRL